MCYEVWLYLYLGFHIMCPVIQLNPEKLVLIGQMLTMSMLNVCRWVSKDGIGALGRLFIGLAIYITLENKSHEYASNSCLRDARWKIWQPF